MYGIPYNLNGKVHPGVSNKTRKNNAGMGLSDLNDNDKMYRGTKYSNPLERNSVDLFGNSNNRNRGNGLDQGMFNSVTNGGSNRLSDQTLKPPKNK